MKRIFVISLALMSLNSFAAAKCPKSTTVVMNCEAANSAKDSQEAVDFMSSASLCADDSNNVTIVLSGGKHGKKSVSYKASPVVNPTGTPVGGMTFKSELGEDESLALTISKGTMNKDFVHFRLYQNGFEFSRLLNCDSL